MRKRRKHEEHEEHADETWLVPYSDILTLLLALFIVLFASSQIDATKLKAIEASFRQAFSGYSGILESGQAPIPDMTPSSPQTPQAELAEKELSKLTSLQENVNRYIAQNNLQGQIDTMITDEGLVFEVKNELLFKPGEATISTAAIPLLTKIADLLGMMTQQVAISGHTDDTSINTPEFPTNWDLSSKRAINVMRGLLRFNPELSPQRFSAIGHGEYKPIVPNITPENRNKNRRVEIMIVRTYPILK